MKYLLKENNELAVSLINHEIEMFNAITILKQKIEVFETGLEITEPWTVIDQAIKKTFIFPNATIDYNLDALGQKERYYELQALHNKYSSFLNTQQMTDDRKEILKESQRVYTSNEKQNEAYELFHLVKDSLIKLKRLGVVLDLNKSYLVTRVISGDERQAVPLNIDPNALYNAITILK